MPTAVVFPGQGAQEPGLGRAWLDDPAWGVVARAEEASGRDLSHLLVHADAEELARTDNAQLTMLIHGLVVWEAVRPRLEEAPVAFAGHSLGQLTALVAAGAVGLEDGVRLAVVRAEATQAAADERPGAMAAVLGLDVAQVEELCHATEDCWVANHNAPAQIAVGGTPAAVDTVARAARGAGAKKVVPLRVGGAFHTPLMASARAALGPSLDHTPFSDTSAPVVANHDGRAHRDGAGWPDRLGRHLTERVRWHDCSCTLAESGADRVIEVGAARLLGPMMRRSVRGLDVHGIAAPDDLVELDRGAAEPVEAEG